MKKENVLLLEDATDMQQIVQATLGEVCNLTIARSISEAADALSTKSYSLILLDVVLSDGSGFDLCKRLRENEQHKDLQIIFLTDEKKVDSRVLGFDSGADDYITKPFEPAELKARVVSKLKRSKAVQNQISFSSGIFHIDLSVQKASLRKGEFRQSLELTPIEFKLLVQFLKNENTVFSREELLSTVWGNSMHVTEHTVDTHISSLRKKVGEYGRCFKAVIRQGYRYDSVIKPKRQA